MEPSSVPSYFQYFSHAPTLTKWQIDNVGNPNTTIDNEIIIKYQVSGTNTTIDAFDQNFIFEMRDYNCGGLPTTDGFINWHELFFEPSPFKENHGILKFTFTVDLVKIKESGLGLWLEDSDELKFCLRSGLTAASEGIDVELAKVETMLKFDYIMKSGIANLGLEGNGNGLAVNNLVDGGDDIKVMGITQNMNTGACICEESGDGSIGCVDKALRSNADFEVCVFPKLDGVEINKIKSVSLVQGMLKYDPVNSLGVPNTISYIVNAIGKTIKAGNKDYDDVKKVGTKALPMFFEDISKGMTIRGSVIFQVKSSETITRRLAEQIRESDKSIVDADKEEQEYFSLIVNLISDGENVQASIGKRNILFLLLAIIAMTLLILTILYMDRKKDPKNQPPRQNYSG